MQTACVTIGKNRVGASKIIIMTTNILSSTAQEKPDG